MTIECTIVFDKKITMKMKVLSPNNAQTRVLNNLKSTKMIHHEFKGEITSSLAPQLNHSFYNNKHPKYKIQILNV